MLAKDNIGKLMKMFIKLIIITLSVLLLLFIILVIIEHKRMNQYPSFPNNIDTRYHVDTIHIKDPVVGKILDRYYVFERKTISQYSSDDSSFIARMDVYPLNQNETAEYGSFKKSKFKIDSRTFYAESYFLKDEEFMNGIRIYNFKYEPKYFVLSFYKKTRAVRDWDKFNNKFSDDQYTYHFLKDFDLVLSPIFTIRQQRKMDKEHESMH